MVGDPPRWRGVRPAFVTPVSREEPTAERLEMLLALERCPSAGAEFGPRFGLVPTRRSPPGRPRLAAAHDSLPFRRRPQLHAAIAERYVDSGDVVDVELALHHEQADMLAGAFSCARAAGLDAKNRSCSSLRPRSPW